MSVVGVDWGYQNSVIAAAGRGGVDVLLNGNSNRLNPTLVGFSECRKMGEAAVSGRSSNFKNTINGCMKRLIGLAFDDPRAQKEMKMNPGLTFCPVQHAGGQMATVGVEVQFDGKSTVVPMEQIAGMMLQHLATICPKEAPAQDWVIAIPNFYTDPQRRALLSACQMVGLSSSAILRLLHENTATALAYGIFKDLKKEFADATPEQPAKVMFLDMGASAYTVSIAAFEPGKLTVKSAVCDDSLGGRDFDWVIAEWVAQKFEEKYRGKLSGKPMERPKSRLKLLQAAEKAKKTLSPAGVKEVRIQLEMVMDDLDFMIMLTAAEYEEMCRPLLAKLRSPIMACLQEAGCSTTEPTKDLRSIEIVGGSTRIGCIKREFLNILHCDRLSTTMNADEAVARGAALQSAILSAKFKVLPYEIVESQPYPIQIHWDEDSGGGVEVDMSGNADEAEPTNEVVMFGRGLSFPIVRRVTLKRAGTFNVCTRYDEKALMYGYPPEVQREIAEFTIKGAVGATPEPKKVRVNVKEDIHGIVHLSSAQMVEEIVEDAPAEAPADGGEAKEEAEKKKKVKKTNLDFSVTRPLDWTDADVQKVYESEVSMANHDRIHKETADMRNELESYIYDMRDKVMSESHLGPYGTEKEKSDFAAKNEAMETWLYEDGFDAAKSVYAEKLAELKALGSPIQKRLFEAQSRPAAVRTLQDNLEMYNKWVNESQADEKYAHITDEERQTVHATCDAISAWVYDMLDKQGYLATNQDPVLTVADVTAKNKELNDKCRPIMTKRAPPKKKVEPKKEENPGAASGDEGKKEGGTPMEGVETESKEGVEDPTKMDVD